MTLFPFPFPLSASALGSLSVLLYLLIGFAFGYVLEISGFGNSIKLAGQFYFKELTVLKVMFTAIIVAFLGRLHPVGILLAGLIVALSYIGGENAQIEVGLPQAVTGVFQGLLLFFLLATDLLVRYRLRLTTTAPARA